MPASYIDFNWPNELLPTWGATSPSGLPLTSGGLIDTHALGMPASIPGSDLTTGIQGSSVSIPNTGSQSIPNTATANPTGNASANATAAAPSLEPGSLADYFARSIIVVLGFIFIAVGLRMLGINVPRINPT